MEKNDRNESILLSYAKDIAIASGGDKVKADDILNITMDIMSRFEFMFLAEGGDNNMTGKQNSAWEKYIAVNQK